ncbi:dolichyl-phosphate beta-glucosyltransferase [Homoserinibacter sp. GY 40078]|uniref:dolichyl-phosphate beta-glucosyltransferase n=1 Tax=Homoserinibacter sp. GY 40078 TaxID=2603275 RepID=UPI001C9BC70A|nr:dolichyl-phosphate beta-glucosyltransferase [Homoserinibacter sp. GY 40078]
MSESSTAYRAYRSWVTEPLSAPPVVSVIIPAYNEEWRILPTIGAIATHMSARGEPWELIISDDGSRDTTVELVRDLRFANLTLLVAEENAGKGSAVRRGVRAARGDIVLVADADQSTPIEQYDRLAASLETGSALVIGSRAADGAAVRGKSIGRRIVSRGLHLLVAYGFGVRVADTQCGFKILRADAAKRLFDLQQLDGFSFDLEVLYLAHKLGYEVTEVPVEWIDAPGSTVDVAKVSMQFLRDLVRIRMYDLRGRYARSRPESEPRVPTPAHDAVDEGTRV